MPRSDRSSDGDDGTITTDEEQIGPTSPVDQRKPAPWQIVTSAQSQPPQIPSTSSAPAVPTRRALTVQVQSPKSPISPTSRLQEIVQLAEPNGRRATVTGPNARFRAAVIKVMRLKRIKAHGLTDADPGIDVTSDAAQALYGPIHERCTIEAMDYGATRCKHTKLTNEELQHHIVRTEAFRNLISMLTEGLF